MNLRGRFKTFDFDQNKDNEDDINMTELAFDS